MTDVESDKKQKVKEFDYSSAGGEEKLALNLSDVSWTQPVQHERSKAVSQTERRDSKVIAAAKALAQTVSTRKGSFISSGITLEWTNLEYSFKQEKKKLWPFSEAKSAYSKKVLSDVSGKLLPGDFMALVGPESSGKSVFLKILAGRYRDPSRLKGKVRYNGKPFHPRFLQDMGFVDSFVYLQENLTVKESLMYIARLRMPPEDEEIDIIVRVEHVLDSLELTQCANTVVGKAGGALNNERRRLGIGLAMISNPKILLLDEPTSGLDGALALRITRMLSAYASAGRTVIASFNTPSHSVFEQFSHLLFLFEGNALYNGPAKETFAYFEGLGFKQGPNVSPGEFLLELAVPEQDEASVHYGTTLLLIKSWRERQSHSVIKDTIVEEVGDSSAEDGFREGLEAGHDAVLAAEEEDSLEWHRSSWLRQFSILLSRNSRAYRLWDLGGLQVFFTVTVFSIVIGCLWYHTDDSVEGIRDRAGLIYLVTLFWGLFPMISTILIFYLDRNLLRCEQEEGLYAISAYFSSRVVLFLPFEIFPPLLFGAIVFWMSRLASSFRSFVLFELVLVLDAMVSSSVGLAVGALADSAKSAIWIATIVFAASFTVVDFLALNAPAWASWLQYLSFATYIRKLLLRIAFDTTATYQCTLSSISSNGSVTPVAATCLYGDHPEVAGHASNIRGGGSVEVLALLAMLIGFHVVAYLLLKSKTIVTGTQRVYHELMRGSSLK